MVARGNTRALDLYIYDLWGQHRPLHLISNDKSSAVVNYLNGFRICDRWGKKEKRSQDGVPGSQRGDLTYMSLRLGGWDRRLIQDHGGAVRKGGGWEVLPKRRGREELRHRRVERELIRDCSSRRRARAKAMACTSDGRGRVLGCRLRQCPPSPLRRLRRLPRMLAAGMLRKCRPTPKRGSHPIQVPRGRVV